MQVSSAIRLQLLVLHIVILGYYHRYKDCNLALQEAAW